MSSAIEVLKNMIAIEKKAIAKGDYETPFLPDELNALGEALLALQNIERIKMMMSAEIGDCQDVLSKDNYSKAIKTKCVGRLKLTKEVLGELK